MISIADKSSCCGCNACADACQNGAISFVADDEGFLYPRVDAAKCTNCGLCVRVCPWIDSEKNRVNVGEPQGYVAVHKNLPTRFASTSGGVFTALANAVYRRGGFVGGAVWTDDFGVCHMISDNPADLLKIRGSKYIQSDLRGFYRQVREVLAMGRPVLVCGTPCQMAAMRSFLGRIPDNLYIVDFICCGNNSPIAMAKYIAWHEEKVGSKVVSIRQKGKELGWRRLAIKLTFKNGKVVYDPRDTSLFTRGFIETHQFCRPACYACKVKGFPRLADLTIADYWGPREVLDPSLDQDLGTSGVFVNNERGAKLWHLASSSLRTQSLPIENLVANNSMVSTSLTPATCDRKVFFDCLRSEGFDGVRSKYYAATLGEVDSFCKRVRKVVGRWLRMLSAARAHGSWRFLLDNRIAAIVHGHPVVYTASGVSLCKQGELKLASDVYLGTGYHRHAPLLTAVRIAPRGRMVFGGFANISYGADIEVFDDAVLEIGDDAIFNVGATIVCGGRITIGKGVSFGRNITVRDNNGGHFTNLPGYKNVVPVEIGDHVWVCEGATILPGVKIGSGAIIGAKAVVMSNVPANTLVMGNPAKVVAEGVEWKR